MRAKLVTALVLTAAASGSPGWAKTVEPLIDGEHPREYLFESKLDEATGSYISEVSTQNQVSVTEGQMTAEELASKPQPSPLPAIPVLSPSFRAELERSPATRLQKVHVLLKQTPKLHYLANKRSDEARRLVQLEEAEGGRLQQKARAWLASKGARILSSSLTRGYLCLELPSALILKLAGQPDVLTIEKDEPLQAQMNTARQMTYAGTVYDFSNPWNANPPISSQNQGFWYLRGVKGAGVTIGLIDSGIDHLHPDLATLDGVTPKILQAKDMVTGDADGNDPRDYFNHGTPVAGAITSTGRNSRHVNYGVWYQVPIFSGIAPESKLRSWKVARAVLQNGVITYPSDQWDMQAIIDSFTEASTAGPAGVPQSDVINASLGYFTSTPNAINVERAADDAYDRGTAVFTVAGNSGPNQGTVLVPGTARKALTVGSVGTGASTQPQWQIMNHSSRGPTTDGRIKPEIVAPEGLTSSHRQRPYPGSPTNDWANGYYSSPHGGTSMATPLVTGGAALWISYFNQSGGISPGALYSLLMATADWKPVINPQVNPSSYGTLYPTVFTHNFSAGAGVLDLGGGHQSVNPQVKTTTYAIGQGQIHEYQIFAFAIPNKRISAALWYPDRKNSGGTYQHADLDMELVAPNGTVYSDGLINTTTAHLSVPNPASGYWKVRVKGFSVPSVTLPGGTVSTTQPYYVTIATRF